MLRKSFIYNELKVPISAFLLTFLLLTNVWSVATIIKKMTIKKMSTLNAKDTIILSGKKSEKNILGSKNKVTSTQIATPTSSPSVTPTPAPKTTSVRLGVVVNDYANKSGELSSLQALLSKDFSTVSVYKQFGLPENSTFNLSDFDFIKSHNIKLLIAWEPWDPREQMHQSRDYLKEIAEGKQDNYIKEFASSIKIYGAPVTIRFGHEMNGDWYPWGKRPTEYINAYRRIVLLLRNEGVQNATWMWSVNANPLSNITQYYPGDEYVDTIGIDGFNFGPTRPNTPWLSFKQVFYEAYNLMLLNYVHKPISISETASSETGGSKSIWIKEMYYDIAHSMPEIQEIIWFNLIKETDWRINSSPSSLQSFKQNT